MRVFIIISLSISLSLSLPPLSSPALACQSGEPSFVKGVKRLVGKKDHSFFVWFEGGVQEVNRLLINSEIFFEIPPQEVPVFKSKREALKGRVARDKVLLFVFGKMVLGAWELVDGRLVTLRRVTQTRCGPGSTPGFIR